MKVDFVRFKAGDDVELQGWLTNVDGNKAVIHIHGMSGNGYQNNFLDNLREMYAGQGVSMFTFDTRGRGVIDSFRQGEGSKLGGSCYEIFEESIHDIQGAIDYLKSLGKTSFVLQGHSLGCTKVVNFVTSQDSVRIEKVILLAPTDMVGWAQTDPKHEEYLAKAKELLAQNKGQELAGTQCWLDKTPISAQTYPTICEAGSTADMYGDRAGGALLSKVEQPTLILYGDADIGITEVDGTADKWLERVNKIKHANTEVVIVKGAPHSFRDHEIELAAAVQKFIEK